MLAVIIGLIKSQVFLLPVVNRWFPFIQIPLAKYATGLSLRYFQYVATQIIEKQLLDVYCDISYAPYISTRTIMLCEYQQFVQTCMKWFLDTVNQILKEDGIFARIDDLSSKMDIILTRMGAIEQRMDAIEQRLDSIEQRLDYMINPSMMASGILESDDLIHE